MWWKVAIAAALLLWLSRSKAAAAAPAPAPAPTGTVDLGPSTVVFHEGSGAWSDVWKRPAGEDSGCEYDAEFAGYRCNILR